MNAISPRFKASLTDLLALVEPYTWAALILLAGPLLWPFRVVGLPTSADGLLHLLRLVVLDDHIRQGVFYPRWVPEMVLGLGYPLFHFYAPGSYYVAESFRLAGLAYIPALLTTFATFVLVAGFGMYLLVWDLFTDGDRRSRSWAALLAGVMYMYSPYLLTNMYMRGALAEVAAQALLPWVFWSFRRLMQGGARLAIYWLRACCWPGWR
ncbi:MAG: hypothetical protein HC802_12295 [Caldilineaceae bacterium]|nr:hypothetical protein [Caldilineaceae bacterium]